jgi:hypothetical protein
MLRLSSPGNKIAARFSINSIVENYITLTLQDARSLFELFSDCQKASDSLQNFKDSAMKLTNK